jgi:tetratricopeptide (TPR) repeat protein
MKKALLISWCLFIVSGSVWSQEGKKAFKIAQKALNQYNLNTEEFPKLSEAKTAIDAAILDKDLQRESKVWQLRGDVYNEIVTQYVITYRTNIGEIDTSLVEGNPALVASQSYRKALELATKKYEIRDALRGLFAMQGNLSNFGLFRYEDGQFLVAHNSFKEILTIHKMLKEYGEESMMDKKEVLDNQLFITGLSALNAGHANVAKPYFQQLYDKRYDKPAVYEALYQIVSDEEGPESAYYILDDGRKRYPKDVSLLFADINHYLRINQLDLLIGKLGEAVRAEPQNVSLYFTLGSVYDHLYQKANETADSILAERYFEYALDHYQKAITINPDYFDAIYSIGVLYYNRAALITTKMNELSDDYSQAALKEYDSLKKDIFKQFDLALPYFQQCEKLDPNNANTLIALVEIFSKKENTLLTEEFRKRLEKVKSGIMNEAPFFQN